MSKFGRKIEPSAESSFHDKNARNSDQKLR